MCIRNFISFSVSVHIGISLVSLKLEDLTIGYDKPVVSDIDLELRSPALVQVMGPNGAGKTTLLKTIIGVLKPLKGKIFVNNDDITGDPEKAGRYISYVPQIATYILGNVFPITVREFIEFEAKVYARRTRSRVDVDKVVDEILEIVEIPKELWSKGIDKLSGGQRQRLLIARALIADVPIIAMDEPLSAVDVEGKALLSNTLSKLKERNRIVIITCHDPELLMNYTDYIMLIGNNTYVFGKPDEVLQPHILAKFYRSSFIEFEKHIHICDFHL
jgi:zinc/manganese transport system ATP-binding protein